MDSIKRVSYAYNSVLEGLGQEAYFLDAMVFEDGEMLVDVHKQFRTKKEFMEEAKKVIPLLGQEENE